MESTVMEVLGRYGYNEVALPIYEYYDVLKTITHNFRDENNISFVDRTSGRMMVLRPDFTPQVCRMVAGYKKDFPLPLRVCYRGTIFRNVNIDQGAKAEKYQIGCELYGSKEIYGDLELILCLNAVMSKVGVDNFRVVFGDAAYMSRLLELLGDSGEEYRRILAEKALYEIEPFLDTLKIDSQLFALLKKLPTAFGGLKELRELIELSAFDPVLVGRGRYIESFFNDAIRHDFDESKIVFDPSEARGLDYYTGINFEILNTSTGASFGGGGRYDTLMKKFGLDYTACGMALYLSEIEAVAECELSSAGADYLVIGNSNMGKAEKLRKQGYTVIHLFDGDDPSRFLKLVNANNVIGDK